MIKEFNGELKNLKSILNEIEKLKIIRQFEMKQAYVASKEIEELETKKVGALEELDKNLDFLRLRNTYFRKIPTNIEEEIELRSLKRKRWVR